MLQYLKRLIRSEARTHEKKSYITPELHDEMLAKKEAVAERRRAFWQTLPLAEQRRRKFELGKRIRTNEAMSFLVVEDSTGTHAGFPLFVFFITLHDMLSPACDQLLTEEVLLAGLKCNAYSRGRFQRIGELEGFVEIQPRWVEQLGEPL